MTEPLQAFKGGHLPGAINIPAKKLPDRVVRLKHDKPCAVICGAGNDSRRVTDFLACQAHPGTTVSVPGGTSA